MSSPVFAFSHLRVIHVSKYQDLRVRITLDGIIQESLESTLDAGVHIWREPFSFLASSVSLCEIHVLAKKANFFCCAGRYKTIRTTRLLRFADLLDTRTNAGDIQLPLYDSTKTDANGAAMGSIVLSITDTVANDSFDPSLSNRERASSTPSLRFSQTVPERLPSESHASTTSPSPCPMALTPPVSPPNLPPQPLSTPETFTPQYLQPSTLLPQCHFGYSPQKSGADRISTQTDTYGDAFVHPKYVFSPGILPDETTTAVSSPEDSLSGPAPESSTGIGCFTPVICEPPEDIACEGLESWSSVPLPTTESIFLPSSLQGFGHGPVPQINISLARSSRGNSPLAPSTSDSDVTIKRPSVHVDTSSVTQAMGVTPAFPVSPALADESSILASPQPKTSTTNTSSSGLSPFSRTSMMESPSTAATTPAQSAVSEGSRYVLSASPGLNAKQRKKRPTIDTSCVGPRGQVKQRSVPPVHVPVKFRNASLDLSRCHEYEKFEPNPSMYSIAPSISPRHFKQSGDSRCPSSQSPESRQGLAPSTRARAQPLEFDEAQICLDTANLGDQEVATFIKEVDAALSALVNGARAVAADSRAFLTVPGTSGRLVSRHQSRKPSSQQLRADLSATVRSHEKEGKARTGFSLVATSHTTPHSDVTPSRAVLPLCGQTDAVSRLFLGSLPGSSSRSAASASTFPLPQRVSPQPSTRQELVAPSFASISTRTKEHLQRRSRPGSYYGDVNGNENIPEVVILETP